MSEANKWKRLSGSQYRKVLEEKRNRRKCGQKNCKFKYLF